MESIKIESGLNPSQTLHAIAAALPQVEFKPEYHNGTGYFDRLTKTDFEFNKGGYVATKTPEGRVIVVVKTAIGNYVFFDRYTGSDNTNVTSNEPYGYASFNGFIGFGGALSTELLIKLFGQWNLDGHWVFSSDTPSNFQRAIASIARPVTADDEI